MVTAYHVIVDILVPAIMLLVFLSGIYIARRAPEKVPAIAGFSAGLVAFAIYAVGSFRDFHAVPFNAASLPAFQWIPTVGGALIGLLVFWLLQQLKLNSGLVGLFVLLLVASSSIAAFSYFFESPLRRYVIYFTLGMLFGMLLYIALFYDSLRDVDEVSELLHGRRRQLPRPGFGLKERVVLNLPNVPNDLVEYLFNINQGSHIDAYCSKEKMITDQVVISYSQLSQFSGHEPERIVGRIFDIVPGVRLFLGKPTLCRCGTVNR